MYHNNNRVKDGKVVESGSHEELIKKASLNEDGGIYYEMWQKQLHDESETLSDTTQNVESGNSSAVEDSHKHSKPEKMDTQIIDLTDDTPTTESNTALPSTEQLEVIELEEEEEEEEAEENVYNNQTEEPQEHVHNVQTEEPEEINVPSTSTSSSRSATAPNTNKKKKKKRRSTRK